MGKHLPAAIYVHQSALILPTNDGHPVKRVNDATEVNHDKTIRKEALALAEKIGIPKAAREPGPHDSQLYGWRSKAWAKQDQSDLEQSLAAENARLKRKPAELSEALAIVKKAATYFARSLQ